MLLHWLQLKQHMSNARSRRVDGCATAKFKSSPHQNHETVHTRRSQRSNPAVHPNPALTPTVQVSTSRGQIRPNTEDSHLDTLTSPLTIHFSALTSPRSQTITTRPSVVALPNSKSQNPPRVFPERSSTRGAPPPPTPTFPWSSRAAADGDGGDQHRHDGRRLLRRAQRDPRLD
jgi:hypothetical protein